MWRERSIDQRSSKGTVVFVFAKQADTRDASVDHEEPRDGEKKTRVSGAESSECQKKKTREGNAEKRRKKKAVSESKLRINMASARKK